jgi:YidC/Oxa1 family membrane protein insertase
MGEEEKEQMEKSQVILKFLPLLIGFFSLQVPAGLTIYWFTSNGFTLLQSLAVRAYYQANPPQIELPDYWDALEDMESMTPEEQRKAAQAGISVGPKFEDLLTGTFVRNHKSLLACAIPKFFNSCRSPFLLVSYACNVCFVLYIAEAKFHVLVDRKALRQDNAAWQRIADDSMVIPPEMQTWVSAIATSDEPAAEKASATA